MIEAWALADRSALAKLLGCAAAELDYRSPEDLWGPVDDGDGRSNHPKCVWLRVTGRKGKATSRRRAAARVTMADIGAEASPEVLARECPQSFVPFRREVQRIREQIDDGD